MRCVLPPAAFPVDGRWPWGRRLRESIQWRDRAGFSPASLILRELAFATPEALTLKKNHAENEQASTHRLSESNAFDPSRHSPLTSRRAALPLRHNSL